MEDIFGGFVMYVGMSGEQEFVKGLLVTRVVQTVLKVLLFLKSPRGGWIH